MARPSFRRFKIIVIYVAVFIGLADFFYNAIGLAFSYAEWTTEKRGVFTRLWTLAISREGGIIITGVLAIFALTTMLVDRRVEAARDLKWKRRKLVLDHKTVRLTKSKRKTLSDSQREQLFSFQQEIKELHRLADHGRLELLDVKIEDWETRVGPFLESVWDRNHRAFVLDAPYEPAHRAGYDKQNRLIGWTHVRPDRMNQLIEEMREH